MGVTGKKAASPRDELASGILWGSGGSFMGL